MWTIYGFTKHGLIDEAHNLNDEEVREVGKAFRARGLQTFTVDPRVEAERLAREQQAARELEDDQRQYTQDE